MSAEEGKPAGGSAKELERLRDILYGEQARTTENRLADLEARLEKARGELSTSFRKEHKTLQNALEKQIKNLSQQGDANQVKAAECLDAVRLELTTDFTNRLNDQATQLLELRQQLAEISTALEENKVSRRDLGAILIEMGQRVLGEET